MSFWYVLLFSRALTVHHGKPYFSKLSSLVSLAEMYTWFAMTQLQFELGNNRSIQDLCRKVGQSC